MQIEWFVFHKNSILGPFTTDEVNSHSHSGKINHESFVWWKGEKDWIPLDYWLRHYPEIIRKVETHFNVNWKIRVGKNTTPYMSFEEALQYLKVLELNNSIYICKKSPNDEEEWETIFSNIVFLNALEMTRRKHPRVPILATAKISKLESKFSYLVKVNTIGQGGMGILGLGKNFPTGTIIHVKVESPVFNQGLTSEGRVLYHTKEGISGIEFKIMNAESKATLISYVNQFSGMPSTKEKKTI